MSKKKNKKRRKHLARMRGNRNQNNLQNQQVHEPLQSQQSTTTSSVAEPTISLQDSDETPPKSPVASDVRKIAILMTSLAAVVVIVAILNTQTDYINVAGQKVMQVLHIYGS